MRSRSSGLELGRGKSEFEEVGNRLSNIPTMCLFSPPTTADADPLVTGAPGAPMDLQCHDANRDYVIVSWKPPNTTTESPVIGYFIDR